MLIARLAICLMSLCFSSWAIADVKFDKPVTIVVAFPPGGDTDVIARLLADRLSARIGQPVLVQNKPGASGMIGNRFVAAASPDGTTLLLTPSTIVTTQLIISHAVKTNITTDFTPIVQITKDTVLVIAVNGNLGIRNHKDLTTAIQLRQVQFYGSPGNGSPMHMVGEYYKNATDSAIEQIAYKGNAPALMALLSGEVPMIVTSVLPVLPYIADGRIVVIGAASDSRSSFLPNVPTFAEQGLPKADFSGWMVLLGPKGMDQKVVAELNLHVNEILKDPEFKKRLSSLGQNPAGGTTAQQTSVLIQDLYDRFATNLEKFKIKIDAQ